MAAKRIPIIIRGFRKQGALLPEAFQGIIFAFRMRAVQKEGGILPCKGDAAVQIQDFLRNIRAEGGREGCPAGEAGM